MKTLKGGNLWMVLLGIIVFQAVAARGGLPVIELGTLPGDTTSSAAAINNRGEIVGSSRGANGLSHAFLYQGGRMQSLCSEPSTATAINDSGQAVGARLILSTNMLIGPILAPPTNGFPILPLPPTNIIVIPITNIISRPFSNITGSVLSSPDTTGVIPEVADRTISVEESNPPVFTNIAYYLSQAAIFRPGRTAQLLAGTNGGTATGINTPGEIIGNVFLATNTLNGAFSYWNGGFTHLNTGAEFMAYGINDRGDIVGNIFSSSLSGDLALFQIHPILYSRGVAYDLGSLGGSEGEARAINSQGDITGYSMTTSNASMHAFLYHQGRMLDLGTLAGRQGDENTNSSYGIYGSLAQAINNRDEVVGQDNSTPLGARAFFYVNGMMLDLNDWVKLTSTDGPPGFLVLTSANGINDWGEIVGEGYYWDGEQVHVRAFLLMAL